MKKKERMKIYTLLFGALVVCPMQAQTVHDWENHHVLQINRKPARAAFIPFSTQKGDCSVCFYQTNFNDKDWTDFPVPANWEINGYGTPIYVSAGYPFKIDPSRVMGGTQGGLCDLSRKESGRAVSAASYGYWQMKV